MGSSCISQGTPKGEGSDFEDGFPHDLTKVIGGGGLSGLSTSVVMPGDEFADVSRTNATGCIGGILGLQSPSPSPTRIRAIVEVSSKAAYVGWHSPAT